MSVGTASLLDRVRFHGLVSIRLTSDQEHSLRHLKQMGEHARRVPYRKHRPIRGSPPIFGHPVFLILGAAARDLVHTIEHVARLSTQCLVKKKTFAIDVTVRAHVFLRQPTGRFKIRRLELPVAILIVLLGSPS